MLQNIATNDEKPRKLLYRKTVIPDAELHLFRLSIKSFVVSCSRFQISESRNIQWKLGQQLKTESGANKKN